MPTARTQREQRPGLSSGLVALMAVATGAVVANLYYAQPVLHQIARSFGTGSAVTSTVVTCTQVGYAAGLLLVVPLGDLHPRRGLVVAVLGVAVGGLVVSATAPTLWLFEAASVVTGAASVAGQVLIPFAADLATPLRRGRVVARIMTGLLLGILLARTVSGLVAQVAGWRTIYWVSAALMVVLALVLWRALPLEGARPQLGYRRLVGSTLGLLAGQPALRRRAWYGACVFAGFSVLWTTLAFLLAGAPYHYSNAVIGLFGLAGVGGVLSANLAGSLADANRVGLSTLSAGVLLVVSFAILAPGRTSVVAVVVGVVVLDLATQAMHITNQAVIYGLVPEARSRINSAYMVCYFLGGAVGSLTAGVVYDHSGWYGVCALGAGFGGLALLMSLYERLRPVPEAAAQRRTRRTPGAEGTVAAGTASGSSSMVMGTGSGSSST